MDTTKKIVEKAGIIPRLQLAVQKTDANGKKLGVESTGPHSVKFISDKSVMGKDPMTAKPRQEIEYLVEEKGVKKVWRVPVFDKNAQPNYLLEKLMDIMPGEEVVLEVKKSGMKNYTSITRPSHHTEIDNDNLPDEDEIENVLAKEAQAPNFEEA